MKIMLEISLAKEKQNKTKNKQQQQNPSNNKKHYWTIQKGRSGLLLSLYYFTLS